MNNSKFIIYAAILALLLSCSGNFEPISYESRSNPNSVASSEASSSSTEGSSSSTVLSSSSPEQGGDSSSSIPSSAQSSSSVEPSSSSIEPSSSSALSLSSTESSSSAELELSSSSTEQSSSSAGLCANFVKDTKRKHYEEEKEQFCDERDGKKYVYVKIGTEATAQIWMAENLNYNATGSRCYGDNTGNDNQNKCATYGRLYNWTTAMNGSTSSSANPSNVQGICPSGWHLPRKSEWTKLTNFVSTDVGEKLKATSGWNKNGNDDGNGTDDYGFSALPGGCYGCEYRENSFGYVGDNGYWWSSDTDGTYASRIMIATNSNYSWGNIKMSVVFLSVRCVQD